MVEPANSSKRLKSCSPKERIKKGRTPRKLNKCLRSVHTSLQSSSVNAVTASVHAWPPRVAARCWQPAARVAASVCRPKGFEPVSAGPHRSKTKTVGRLKSRPQFLAVQKGERRKGRLFLLEVLDRPDDSDLPRVGFTVTKRQGNAVERNRMRRRLKEAVRLTGAFAMQPGYDYVVVGRRDVLQAPFSALTAELEARITQPPRTGRRQKTSAPGSKDGK